MSAHKRCYTYTIKPDQTDIWKYVVVVKDEIGQTMYKDGTAGGYNTGHADTMWGAKSIVRQAIRNRERMRRRGPRSYKRKTIEGKVCK